MSGFESKSSLPSKILQLIEDVKNSSGELRIRYLKVLWDVAKSDEYKVALADPQLELITFLMNLINTETGMCRKNALGCIWYLSRAIPNRAYFGRKELGIVQSLMNLNLTTPVTRTSCFLIFVNIGLHPSTHSYLFSDEVGLIHFYKNHIYENPEAIEGYRLFGNFFPVVDNDYVLFLLKANIHHILMRRLIESGPNPISWFHNRVGGIDYWSLNGMIGVALTENGAEALLELDVYHYFWKMVDYSIGFIECLKAATILVNMYTNCKSTSSPPIQITRILQEFPSLFPFFLTIFTATLECDNGDETPELRNCHYTFGIMPLQVLSQTLKSFLFINPQENIRLFRSYHNELLKNLAYTLELFVSNQPELFTFYDYKVYAGGGGEDYETLLNILEFLLQISMSFSSETNVTEGINQNTNDNHNNSWNLKPLIILKKFIPTRFLPKSVGMEDNFHSLIQQSNIPGLLKAIIDLPPERTVPVKAKILAELILNRLS